MGAHSTNLHVEKISQSELYGTPRDDDVWMRFSSMPIGAMVEPGAWYSQKSRASDDAISRMKTITLYGRHVRCDVIT